MDAVVREMLNITEKMAATDAKKVKAMRTSVGWFSLPTCALIYRELEVRRPSLLPGPRHRRKVLAVAQRRASQQGRRVL
eukprot:5304744-Pleurochrysis_carterae.AAC.1